MRLWRAGRPLPGRTNIVVTRDSGFSHEGIHVVASLKAGLETARQVATDAGKDAVMVIGGGEIYAATMDIADRLEITRVHASPAGDTRFPVIDPALWLETTRETLTFSLPKELRRGRDNSASA